jgi:riboflavin synthase
LAYNSAMFTGLIRDVGKVVEVRKNGNEAQFTIETNLPAENLSLGASVCCSGVCLTVTAQEAKRFSTLASGETLSKTTLGNWQTGMAINLEPSLRVGDELGGHLVFGHVDGVAECVSIKPDAQSRRFSFRVPADIAPFIAAKGSVGIDGVSLTVNEIQGNVFGVNIIPHTAENTSFANLAEGGKVNIEIDMLARYVARFSEFKLYKEAV